MRSSLKLRLFLTVSALFLLASITHGAAIRVPGDYPTIQGAVDAAADGDTVVVYGAGAVYTENVTISKPLTLT